MQANKGKRAWVVLTGMLVLGMAALAIGVWSLTDLIGGGTAYIYAPVAVLSFGAFIFVALLAMGIVYRLDRLAGTANRRIDMFE